MCYDPECNEGCSCWKRGYETAEEKMQSEVDELEGTIDELKEKLANIAYDATH